MFILSMKLKLMKGNLSVKIYEQSSKSAANGINREKLAINRRFFSIYILQSLEKLFIERRDRRLY